MCGSASARISLPAAMRSGRSSRFKSAARAKNYYNDLTKRPGYEAAAVDVQDHFLAQGSRGGRAERADRRDRIGRVKRADPRPAPGLTGARQESPLGFTGAGRRHTGSAARQQACVILSALPSSIWSAGKVIDYLVLTKSQFQQVYCVSQAYVFTKLKYCRSQKTRHRVSRSGCWPSIWPARR